jgi:hypothetical protein
MTAREKLAEERRAQREREENMQAQDLQSQEIINTQPIFGDRAKKENQQQFPERRVEQKSYMPKERPMSLSQMQHIAPKKFKSRGRRPNINLEEVRKLVKKTQIQKQSDDDYEIDRRETGR